MDIESLIIPGSENFEKSSNNESSVATIRLKSFFLSERLDSPYPRKEETKLHLERISPIEKFKQSNHI